MTGLPVSVDLHSHTNLSDGVLTPRELVRAAAAAGIDVLAVTDHDTTEAIPEARAEADALGLRLVPGMEVSAHHADRSVHVLAYFAQDALERLDAFQEERRASRQRRVLLILERLSELGLEVDRTALTFGIDPRRSPGRPHVARALLAAGHVESMQEAFESYLGRGKPAYVADQGPSAANAIRMIHGLPGLAVVAHPGIEDVADSIEELAELGLDGVEAYHFGHSPQLAAQLQERARGLQLLVTGGSDFHGSTDPNEVDAERAARLGRVALPPEEWERFAAALARLEGRPGMRRVRGLLGL